MSKSKNKHEKTGCAQIPPQQFSWFHEIRNVLQQSQQPSATIKPVEKEKIEGLYIVSTPIGNRLDITLRALIILENVDVIACEDTRQTKKLLSFYGINKPLLSYHDHSSSKDRLKIIDQLEKENTIAYMSDAGTPLISDPGYKLILEAKTKNIKITPIGGLSSVTTALSVAALPTDKFTFCGFLAHKREALSKQLDTDLLLPTTLIFFDTAKNLIQTLMLLSQKAPARTIVIARELTKRHEEILSDTASNLLDHLTTKTIKGEIVLLISPGDNPSYSHDQLVDLLKTSLEKNHVKDACAEVAEITGQSKKMLYQLALDLKNDA